MTRPISRCLMEATSVTRDKRGNVAVTLQRGPFEPDGADLVEMSTTGDQPIVLHMQGGPAIEPGTHYYLDLTPVG